jgi:hypothetical protein
MITPLEQLDAWATTYTEAASALRALCRALVLGGEEERLVRTSGLGLKSERGRGVIGYRELGRLIVNLEVQ